ncbi:uncharacterized protein LOC132315866 [Cornus florida]|uniref:uncharacterized protein LOC132315866 n=1 Tax=Cornus florida TaxID=4283 RepID=UPI0028A12856|nr:uncharacterized protein LOC132315866 [Cornus florida]
MAKSRASNLEERLLRYNRNGVHSHFRILCDKNTNEPVRAIPEEQAHQEDAEFLMAPYHSTSQPVQVLTSSNEESDEDVQPDDEDEQLQMALYNSTSQPVQVLTQPKIISDDEDEQFQMALYNSTIIDSRSRASIQVTKSRTSNLELRILRYNLNGVNGYFRTLYYKITNEPARILGVCTRSEAIQEEQAHQAYTISDDEVADLQMVLYGSTIINSSNQESEIQDEKKKGAMRFCSITYGDFGSFWWPTKKGDFKSYWWWTKKNGESSHAFCNICNERKPSEWMMIRGTHCHHFYCRDCLRFYVSEKIRQSSRSIKCPAKNCGTLFLAEYCRPFIPEEVFDRWKSVAVEASVPGSPEYILCPFEDCRRVFPDDGKGSMIRACPKCWRPICMRCNVPWHTRTSCSLYQEWRRAYGVPPPPQNPRG